MRSFFYIIAIVVIIFNVACEKESIKTSSYSSSSHNAGKSCNSCHSEVKVCGTVYDTTQTKTVSNVIIKFSTTNNSNGTIKATIEVDNSGNFYTENNIEFSGLYPFVEYTNGSKTQYMQSPITSGDCNSCHKEGNRIWIK